MLIVENDEKLGTALCALCQEIGLCARVSDDGLHAIMSAVQSTPDLIILDCAVPPLGSMSVAQSLCRDSRLSSVPLVILAEDHDPLRTGTQVWREVRRIQKGRNGWRDDLAAELVRLLR